MLKQFAEVHREGNCPRCHMGHLRVRLMTVTRWLESELVIVPGVAVTVCDICGTVVENEDVEEWLTTLLDQVDSRRRQKKRMIEGLLILPVSRGEPH